MKNKMEKGLKKNKGAGLQTSNSNKKQSLVFSSPVLKETESVQSPKTAGSGVELLGWCFVVLCVGQFGVSQFVATFVLLLHAVGEEEEEEHGTQESDHPTCYHRWRGHKEELIYCAPTLAGESGHPKY